MSFPNSPPPPPPPTFMPRTLFDGDVGGFWPQFPLDQFPLEQYPSGHPRFPLNREQSDFHGQFEHAPPPSKRPRGFENNQSNSSSFPPRMNPPNLPGSKGTSHIFYKTRICAKFLEGNCKNGEHCTFAHGMEDLREPPPNWQELVREKDGSAGNWNDDQRLIHKMKICKKFYSGEECPYGDKCNFLHERPIPNFLDERPRFKTEMTRQRESAAISIGTRGSASGNRIDVDQMEINKSVNSNLEATRGKPVFWKTKLCSKWEITGHCPFGERCHFAHGLSELQVPNSRADVEVAVNSGPIQVKPLAVPVSDSSMADVLFGVPTIEGEEKDISKWKPNKKINRIYADWIDDLTPPHSFPSEA